MAALLDLRMPGVYTQEISTLPPTVGVIPSAVPAFIGYTEKAAKKSENLLNKPTRIRSMKEYEDLFGSVPLQNIQVNIDDRASNPNRPQVTVLKPADFKYKMYHELSFYFANGGGPCYIVSVGFYNAEPDMQAMQDAVDKLVKIQDVTILVFPDGTSLTQPNYVTLINHALLHCAKMNDRVTIIDISDANTDSTDDIEKNFQTPVSNDDEKKYGMAYFPYIDTVFSYGYAEANVTVKNHVQDPLSVDDTTKTNISNAAAGLKTKGAAYNAAVKAVNDDSAALDDLQFLASALADYKALNSAADSAAMIKQLTALIASSGIIIDSDTLTAATTANADPIAVLNDAISDKQNELTTAQAAVEPALKALYDKQANTGAVADVKALGANQTSIALAGIDMATIKTVNNALYSKIKDAIANFPVTLPPCGAIAGIYVRTDAASGVWKAPANVSVFGAIKPAIDVDDDLHASLNAPTSGKSINVIRTYPGRGILVYGGRTLDGNSQEWRYVNVRRTFCFIEDSVANAMQDFVFAPNNEQTWIKVKAMIKNFLNKLWKAGGLFGATPEDAYEVVCSVPESMNEDDVLNGIMRIYVKVAVARPAEFIVLQYEHKFDLSES